MKLTLRRLREKKGWSIDILAKLSHIKYETLKDYEEYRKVPSTEEVITMLKIMGFYFDEVVYLIFDDISKKYKG